MSQPTDQPEISNQGSPALRTLLLTDFVSSTELIETLGDKRAAQIFAKHDRKARDILADCGGVEIDKTDGFLFLFTRPIDAVRFSLQYHDMLRVLSEATGTALAARAGVHVGEVILRRNTPDDVARGAKPIEVDGLSKHAAARVMSVALGGQTLMTDTTYAFAKRGAVGETGLPEDIQWICHGQFHLKGIEDPVPLYEVGREGVAPLRPPPDGEKVRRVQSRASDPQAGSRPAWLGGTLAILVLISGVYLGLEKFGDSSPSGSSDTTSPNQKETRLAPSSEVQPSPTSGDSETDQAQDSPAPDAKEEAPELPSKMAFSVSSVPAGATVTVLDTSGPAPYSLQIPAQVGHVRVQAAMRGYHTSQVDCWISQADIDKGSSRCSVELQKKTPKPRTPPPSSATTAPDTPTSDPSPTGYKDNPFGQ